MIEADIELVCAPESTTITVKLDVSPTLGLPEITPVDADRVSPDGRLPDVIDHV